MFFMHLFHLEITSIDINQLTSVLGICIAFSPHLLFLNIYCPTLKIKKCSCKTLTVPVEMTVLFNNNNNDFELLLL